MHNYITVRYQKSMSIFFKIFLVFILTKPHSLTSKIVLNIGYLQNLEKSISVRGAALWTKIKQRLKTLPHITFCKQYKNELSAVILSFGLFLLNNILLYVILWLHLSSAGV